MPKFIKIGEIPRGSAPRPPEKSAFGLQGPHAPLNLVPRAPNRSQGKWVPKWDPKRAPNKKWVPKWDPKGAPNKKWVPKWDPNGPQTNNLDMGHAQPGHGTCPTWHGTCPTSLEYGYAQPMGPNGPGSKQWARTAQGPRIGRRKGMAARG